MVRRPWLVAASAALLAVSARAKAPDEAAARALAEAQEALKGGDSARAVEVLEPFQWKLRNDADFRMTDAFARMGTGDFEASDRDVWWLENNRGTVAEVMALRGRLELARAERARIYGSKGEAERRARKAVAAFSKVPSADAPRPILLELRAQALAESGATDEAIAAYRTLIAADTNRTASFSAAAHAAAEAGRWDEVAHLFSVAESATEAGWAVLRGAISGGEDPSLLPVIAALREHETRPERTAALDAYRTLIVSGAGGLPCDVAVEPDEGLDAADGAAISAAVIRSLVRMSAARGWTRPKAEAPSCGVVLPLLVSKVEPDYPEELRRRRVSGSAVVVARVAKDGTVRVDGVVGAADPAFARAAAEAVEKWRYKPATVGGRPVVIDFVVKVDFFIR